MTEPDRLQWFQERIGKRVWRNNIKLGNDTISKYIYENGLEIESNEHAEVLSELEFHFRFIGVPLRYFDTRKEVIEFEWNN